MKLAWARSSLGSLSPRALLSATLALAHEGATGVVKERMDLMKRQQKDMKLIGDMAKGKTPFDAAKAAEAARDVSVTAKKIHELFPEGSAGGHSEAKQTIWTEWDQLHRKGEGSRTVGRGACRLARRGGR